MNNFESCQAKYLHIITELQKQKIITVPDRARLKALVISQNQDVTDLFNQYQKTLDSESLCNGIQKILNTKVNKFKLDFEKVNDEVDSRNSTQRTSELDITSPHDDRLVKRKIHFNNHRELSKSLKSTV